MRVFLYPVSLVSALLLLTSCREGGPKDIRDYYFPLRQLEDGLVYEYRPLFPDSLTPVYWYYRSFLKEDGVFLTGTYYEYGLIPLQLVREELVRNGMLLQDLYLYEADSTGSQRQARAEVLSGTAFPFEVSDSGGVFLYKVRWEPPSDSGAVITLIKNRRYLRDTSIRFDDKSYDAVVFDVREMLEYDKDGVFEQAYEGREVYAKGLGLVYFQKEISKDIRWAYRLEARYPMSRLEETFKQRIEQKISETE